MHQCSVCDKVKKPTSMRVEFRDMLRDVLRARRQLQRSVAKHSVRKRGRGTITIAHIIPMFTLSVFMASAHSLGLYA